MITDEQRAETERIKRSLERVRLRILKHGETLKGHAGAALSCRVAALRIDDALHEVGQTTRWLT